MNEEILLQPDHPTYKEVTQAASMTLAAFDEINFNDKRKLYETWRSSEFQTTMIMTYQGAQTLQGYITRLEKAAIGLNKELTATKLKYDSVALSTYLNYRFKRFMDNYRMTRLTKKLSKDFK